MTQDELLTAHLDEQVFLAANTGPIRFRNRS